MDAMSPRKPGLLARLGVICLLACLCSGCTSVRPEIDRPNLIQAFPDGKRLVTFDSGNSRLLVTDPDFELLREIPLPGIVESWGLNVAANDDIWLSSIRTQGVHFTAEAWKENALAEILVISPEGQVKKRYSWEGQKGPVVYPSQILPLPDGSFYVCDLQLSRIFLLDAQGKVLREFGSHGDGPGQFYFAEDIDPLPDGRFLITECYNSRLQIIEGDGTHVRFLAEKGQAEGQVYFPEYACFDPDGYLYVSEHGSMRVSVFSPQLEFVRCLYPPKENDTDFLELFGLTYLPARKSLYVGDTIRSVVHVFDEQGKWQKAIDRLALRP